MFKQGLADASVADVNGTAVKQILADKLGTSFVGQQVLSFTNLKPDSHNETKNFALAKVTLDQCCAMAGRARAFRARHCRQRFG